MKKTLMNVLIMIAYLVFAQTAVLLVKLGSQGASLTIIKGNLSISVNLKMILGLCLYVCSFLLWVVLISRSDLSFITPIITGFNYIVPMGIGILLFHEKMSISQWIGAAVILIGLVVINYRGDPGHFIK